MKIVSVCVSPTKKRGKMAVVVVVNKVKGAKLFVYVIDAASEKTLYDGAIDKMAEVGGVLGAISDGGVPPLVEIPTPPPPRGPGGHDLVSTAMRNVWRGYERSV
jgi:hypothetical protein